MNAPDPVSLRRAAFVAAAREAFFAHGYGAMSMSAIAARVGGSKTTLWTYFPSKQALFAAVVDDLVETFGASLDTPLDIALSPAEALRQFGRTMLPIVLSRPIVDLHRIVMGEAGRFPELGTLYFERGPKRGKAKLAAYLEAAMADGRIRRGDPLAVAQQFVGMVQSNLYQHRVLGLIDDADEAAIEADVDRAVDSWMRAWGA